METFRYIVALLLVTIVPAMCCYWLLLHGLLPVWRRLGIPASQYLLWVMVLAIAGILSAWRDVFLARDFGFQAIPATIGIILLAGAVVFRLQIERHMPWRVQLGLPEIDPVGHAHKLVTEGPYEHVRHPRYVQVFLALAGWAFLANYAAAYVAAVLWLPLMLIIVRLEEAELHRRFGAAYTIYRDRVGRFWPHAAPTNHRVKA
jgi:protein-S-isoprenylcysteine O-methyltransferase Ste14